MTRLLDQPLAAERPAQPTRRGAAGVSFACFAGATGLCVAAENLYRFSDLAWLANELYRIEVPAPFWAACLVGLGATGHALFTELRRLGAPSTSGGRPSPPGVGRTPSRPHDHDSPCTPRPRGLRDHH